MVRVPRFIVYVYLSKIGRSSTFPTCPRQLHKVQLLRESTLSCSWTLCQSNLIEAFIMNFANVLWHSTQILFQILKKDGLFFWPSTCNYCTRILCLSNFGQNFFFRILGLCHSVFQAKNRCMIHKTITYTGNWKRDKVHREISMW